ncbi:MAG: CHAT domain-containing protein [Gemmatimonadota bacterium]
MHANIWFVLTLTILPQQEGSRAHDVRGLVLAAEAVVATDSADAFVRRWRARLDENPDDERALLALATVARRSYDGARALELYERLLAGQAEPSDPVRAYAAMGRALVMRESGIGEATDSAFTRTLALARAADDRALEVEVLVYLGSVRARAQGPDAAERIFAEARELLPSSDPRLGALYRCGRAEMLLISGRPDAETAAARGAALAGRAEAYRLRGTCLMIVAGILNRRGRLDSALAVYGRAIRDYRRSRTLPGLAVAHQWRGSLLRRVGRFGEALPDFERAVEVGGEAGAESATAWALAGLVELYADMGDVAAAAAYAAPAIESFARQGDRYGEANARGLRGRLHVAAGNLERAREEWRAAIRIAREIGFAEQQIRSRVALAHVAMLEGDWEGASRELEAARRVDGIDEMPGSRAWLDYHAGTLALREGRTAAALRTLRRVHAETPEWQGDHRYMAAVRIAEASARLGEIDAAAAELAAAFDALDAWREGLDDDRLRVLAFQRNDDHSDPDLGVATVIALLADSGRAGLAFGLAERRRARDLLDRLIRASAMVAADGSAGRSPSPGRVDDALPADSPVADWRSIGAAIPDGRTALLEYVTGYGGEPTTLFVLTRDGPTAQLLPPADTLRDHVARFQALLDAGADARPVARALYTATLAPAVDALPADIDRLVVVPSGPLHTVPLEALIMPDGRHAIERFDIAYAPSASIAARRWRRPGDGERADRLLALADPMPSSGDDEPRPVRSGVVDSARTAGLEPLPATAREARAIGRFATDATILTRRRAREARFGRDDLRGYGVLHFATHALVDDATLARTGLVLSPGEGEDGFLTPGEVARLRLDADLVVLAACRTAGGVAVRGEGIQGLTAAFLGAGARTVVASRWDVADEASARFMEGFYARMAAGEPVAAALRATKVAALRDGAPVREWAAFTVFGDPLVRPALRPPGPWDRFLRAFWPTAAVTLIIGAAIALLLVRRARMTGR